MDFVYFRLNFTLKICIYVEICKVRKPWDFQVRGGDHHPQFVRMGATAPICTRKFLSLINIAKVAGLAYQVGNYDPTLQNLEIATLCFREYFAKI